jgi:hypothetical protein
MRNSFRLQGARFKTATFSPKKESPSFDVYFQISDGWGIGNRFLGMFAEATLWESIPKAVQAALLPVYGPSRW